jgi:hypothetical protein
LLQFEWTPIHGGMRGSSLYTQHKALGADMIPKTTTAENMARTVGVNPETFRDALRDAKFPRKRSTDWEVKIDSHAYSGMRTVLANLIRRKAA